MLGSGLAPQRRGRVGAPASAVAVSSIAAVVVMMTACADNLPTATATAVTTTVTIDNTAPRRDVNGQWMDAHDGNIMQFTPGGPFYMYAMAYGNCQEEATGCAHVAVGACGFRLDHNVSVWSSSTMASGTWKLVGDALPVADRPVGIYYRPKVVFNPTTGKYVLWANLVPGGDFSESAYVVATSDTPEGPFTVASKDSPTRYAAGGDFDLLVDDDNAAYLIYTSVSNGHNMSVEALTPDYVHSLAATDPSKSSGFLPGITFVEAPTLFKRNGMYVAIVAHCCCFCKAGSGAIVYTAPHPLGPWSQQAGGAQVGRLPSGLSVSAAQQNDVFVVKAPDGTEQYVWYGDNWQSAPDHIKAHDLQYWTTLNFTSTGAIEQFVHSDTCSFTV